MRVEGIKCNGRVKAWMQRFIGFKTVVIRGVDHADLHETQLADRLNDSWNENLATGIDDFGLW